MNENRKRILEMLAAGKINADEAERLLAALEKEPSAAAGDESEAHSKAWPKYMRVVIESEEGPAKVNVRVPFQLLRAGVKLTSIIPPHARVKLDDALHKEGIDLDLSELKPEKLEELIYQLKDLTVDIDDKKSKVRIFCE
jgi:polyhydroxyalkanoate synthesis regulator phasin